jgi:putative transposase
VLADRWEPSNKTCSGCGWYDAGLTLTDRTFQCQNQQVPCGLVIDRDLNVAINLAQLAASSADTQNACGEVCAGFLGLATQVKLASLKQEPNALDASA